jgi:hypothetical protein
MCNVDMGLFLSLIWRLKDKNFKNNSYNNLLTDAQYKCKLYEKFR